VSVSVSGSYAWHKREPSLHSREDAELANKLKDAFQSKRCVYRGACGSPRIHAELHVQGIPCDRSTGRASPARAEAGGKTSAPSCRSRRTASKEHQSLRTCSNRTFMLSNPTRNGRVRPRTSGHKRDGCIWRLYLSCSRAGWRVWSMAALVVCSLGRQSTRNGSGSPLSTSGVTPSRRLVAVALRAKALSCSWPPNGMLVSMSRTAHCYDKAVTASFFPSLKGESLDQESFQTRAQA
jgi:putative transposase